ncbi:MAG: glycosyltransferase, partial [Alphaproteobacteria bacterium]|nr:glycosyltransferase [Alphaproteobacteria bacterium]
MKQPFFSIITVAYRDAWAASKTARSVFRQSFDDFEYIFVDGNSQDGTAALVEFWREQSLIDKAVIEPDRGVYDAMNKGIDIASGRYVCFMNAGDVFASDSVLRRAHEILTSSELDGCLGWGELNGQIWASWCPS